jgi:hypothetical protein
MFSGIMNLGSNDIFIIIFIAILVQYINYSSICYQQYIGTNININIGRIRKILIGREYR